MVTNAHSAQARRLLGEPGFSAPLLTRRLRQPTPWKIVEFADDVGMLCLGEYFTDAQDGREASVDSCRISRHPFELV